MAVVRQDGKLLTLGSEDHGKLGHSNKKKTDQEAKQEKLNLMRNGYKPAITQQKAALNIVQELSDHKIVQVACGFQHTVALNDKGEVFSWGQGKYGALGHGNSDDISTPRQIADLKDIVKVECGTDYTLALSKDGSVYAFGNNGYG